MTSVRLWGPVRMWIGVCVGDRGRAHRRIMRALRVRGVRRPAGRRRWLVMGWRSRAGVGLPSRAAGIAIVLALLVMLQSRVSSSAPGLPKFCAQ